MQALRDAYELRYGRLYFGVLSPVLAVVSLSVFYITGVLSASTVVAALSVWLLVEKGSVIAFTTVGQSCRAFQRSVSAALHEQPPRVVIIGAGAAGLSAAAVLHRAGIPYVVLEKNAEVGQPWESRYARLHLHTDRHVSAMPYVDWPTHTPLYPSRLDLAHYLQGYWRTLSLNVRFNAAVQSVSKDADQWTVALENGDMIRAPRIVVAVGQSGRPNLVKPAEEKTFSGPVVHSSSFESGAAYAGKRVLVVGFGNSAQEIAIDLAENGASVDISVRSPICWTTRDIVPDRIPFAQVLLAFGGALMPLSWLDAISNVVPMPLPAGVVKKAQPNVFSGITKGRPPVIDIGLLALAQEGKVKLMPPPPSWKGYDAVIKATGYTRSTLLSGTIEAHLDKEGIPKETGDGLFFIGWNDLVGRIRHMTLDAVRIRNAVLRSGITKK